MAAPDVVMKQGDTTPALVVTLTDAKGNILNLTGATVRMYLRNLTTRQFQVNGAVMTILSPATAGQVQYNWQPADVAVADLFDAEFEVTNGASVETYPEDGYYIIEFEPDLS